MATLNITLSALFEQIQSLWDRRFTDVNPQPASADQQGGDLIVSLQSDSGKQGPSLRDPWLEVARYQRSGRLP